MYSDAYLSLRCVGRENKNVTLRGVDIEKVKNLLVLSLLKIKNSDDHYVMTIDTETAGVKETFTIRIEERWHGSRLIIIAELYYFVIEDDNDFEYIDENDFKMYLKELEAEMT